MSEKHEVYTMNAVDFTETDNGHAEVCRNQHYYKNELDEETWERLLDFLDVDEPATAVCLTQSQVKIFIEENNS